MAAANPPQVDDDEGFDVPADEILLILVWLCTKAEEWCEKNNDRWHIKPPYSGGSLHLCQLQYYDPSYLTNMYNIKELFETRYNHYDWEFLTVFESFDEETTEFLSEVMEESPNNLEKIRTFVRYMKKQQRIKRNQENLATQS